MSESDTEHTQVDIDCVVDIPEPELSHHEEDAGDDEMYRLHCGPSATYERSA